MTDNSKSDRGRKTAIRFDGSNTSDFIKALQDLPCQVAQNQRGTRLTFYSRINAVYVLYKLATSSAVLADSVLEAANAHRVEPFDRAELALSFGYLSHRPEQYGVKTAARRAAQQQASEDSIILRALEDAGAGANDAVTFLLENGGIDGLKQRYRDRHKPQDPEPRSDDTGDTTVDGDVLRTAESAVCAERATQVRKATQAFETASDEMFDDDVAVSTAPDLGSIGYESFQADHLIAHWTEETALGFQDLPDGLIGIWCRKLPPNGRGRSPVVVLGFTKPKLSNAPEAVQRLAALSVIVPGDV